MAADGMPPKLLRLPLTFAPVLDKDMLSPLPCSITHSTGFLTKLYKTTQRLRLEPTFMCLTSPMPTISWSSAVRRPDGDLINDLFLPRPPRTWHRRTRGQMKTYATTIKADLVPLSGPWVLGHARWRNDWVNVSSEHAQDRRAGSASVRDVVNSIGNARGSSALQHGWREVFVTCHMRKGFANSTSTRWNADVSELISSGP